jgi:hypothetical protein
LQLLCGGQTPTVITKFGEAVPVPQALDPLTVRFPEVADAEKVPVIEDVFPDGVNPVPV